MTKVAMIFEKEKEEAIQKEIQKEREKARQALREEKERGRQAVEEEKKKFALKMIADGEISLSKIAGYAGLDIKTVTRLAGQHGGAISLQ